MLKADVSGGWEELRQEICESLNSILTILTLEMEMGHPGWTFQSRVNEASKLRGNIYLLLECLGTSGLDGYLGGMDAQPATLHESWVLWGRSF